MSDPSALRQRGLIYLKAVLMAIATRVHQMEPERAARLLDRKIRFVQGCLVGCILGKGLEVFLAMHKPLDAAFTGLVLQFCLFLGMSLLSRESASIHGLRQAVFMGLVVWQIAVMCACILLGWVVSTTIPLFLPLEKVFPYLYLVMKWSGICSIWMLWAAAVIAAVDALGTGLLLSIAKPQNRSGRKHA